MSQPLFKYVKPERLERIIVDYFAPLGVEPAEVGRSLYRVLAEDVVSPKDLPECDVAHVDGFAVSECDDRTFRVVSGGVLGLCEAAYVETGRPVPEGAVAVVPAESTRLVGEGSITIPRSYERLHGIVRRGSDVARGMVVGKRGQVVTPPLARLLVELGVEEVKVYRRPKLLLIPVGTEFVTNAKRESSSLLVKAMCEAVGALVDTLGPVEDSAETLEEVVRENLELYDAIATIGGASLGRSDYTLATAMKLPDSAVLVRGVAIQPGRVTTLLRAGGKPFVLLPGLIQSTVAGTIFVLQPLIRRLQGAAPRTRYPLGLYRLASDYTYSGRFSSFTRIRFVRSVGDFEVEVIEAESPIQSAVALSHGFAILEPGVVRLTKGVYLPVYRAPGLYPEDP